jgi:hypothetical protein
LALDVNIAAHQAHQLPADRQAQPGAGFLSLGLADLLEGLKNLL